MEGEEEEEEEGLWKEQPLYLSICSLLVNCLVLIHYCTHSN